MKMKVLSGIAKPVLDELIENGTRTIELRSANNIICLKDVSAGDHLLLSDKKFGDIVPGVEGVIGKIKKISRSMHHVSYSSESIYEEKETTIVRIKIDIAGIGEIREILKKDEVGTLAEVEEKIEAYSAG